MEKLEKRPFEEDKINKFYKDKGVNFNSFHLEEVTENSVLKHLKNLKVSKSTGCDKISARFLKDAASVIVTPLTHIINISLMNGLVPDEFKTARVVPLYKKDDRNQEGNYRPVSILPVVSKIFERVVHEQLYNYLCSKELLYERQSGFRPKFSTNTALTFLSDKIRFNMDNGFYTGVVLLDLQKAFDTVDHSILMSKLRAIGADKLTVKWFTSYLSGRKQFVDVDGTYSGEDDVRCGVPQGSILGPLLFTIYVNDMPGAVDCKLCLYADDSLLIVSGKDIRKVEHELEIQMDKISKWLQSNKLSLHLGKTESIVFGSKCKLRHVSKMNMSKNQIIVQKTNTTLPFLKVRVWYEISF